MLAIFFSSYGEIFEKFQDLGDAVFQSLWEDPAEALAA